MPRPTSTGARRRCRDSLIALAGLAVAAGAPASALAGSPPEIRIHEANRVPQCVTPESLMAFLRSRNEALPPRFQTIAFHYRELGEGWRIRWDYAFYQMVIETNYLKFRRGDGSPGDVSASQNNFAGIGATGGGVPGDRFPDVRTGVLAQMQHLVAYSGERVAQPVAPRTRERQGDIIDLSLKLNRPVTFGDLARRWAADKAYAVSIETVAELFRRDFCRQPDTSQQASARPLPPERFARGSSSNPGASYQGPANSPAEPSALALPARAQRPPAVAAQPAPPPRPASACGLFTASYGGDRVQLISSRHGEHFRLTALTVSSAQAQEMTAAFIATHAPGGTVIGAYPNVEDALTAGRKVCQQG